MAHLMNFCQFCLLLLCTINKCCVSQITFPDHVNSTRSNFVVNDFFQFVKVTQNETELEPVDEEGQILKQDFEQLKQFTYLELAKLKIELQNAKTEIHRNQNKLACIFKDNSSVKKCRQQFLQKPTNDILDSILTKPKARLYSGPNFTGDYEDYNFTQKSQIYPGCYSLNKLAGKIQSVQTFGTCIRLYNASENGCDGWSLAMYPKIWGTQETLTLEGVKDVGPCFENELDMAKLDYNENNQPEFMKLKGQDSELIIPDLVPLGWAKDYSLTSKAPIEYYRTGYDGRVEYLRAVIQKSDLERGHEQGFNLTQILYKEGGIATDFIGHPIGQRFGPPRDTPFNVAPLQTEGLKILQDWEEKIEKFVLNSETSVHVYVHVIYSDGESMRPIGLSYYVNDFKGFRHIFYVPNNQ